MIYLISAYLTASLTIPNLAVSGTPLLPVCTIVLLLFNYYQLRYINVNSYLIILLLIIIQVYFLYTSIIIDYMRINFINVLQRTLSHAGPITYVFFGMLISRINDSEKALKLTVVFTVSILIIVNALMIYLFNDLFWLRQLETLESLIQYGYDFIPQTIFTNANQTARTILFLLIIVLITKSNWTQTSYILLLVCLTCLMLLTSSKANIVAMLMLLFVNVLLSGLNRDKKLMYGLMATSILCLVVIFEPRFEKLTKDVTDVFVDDVSQKYQPIRIRNLLASLEVISENPFGAGIIEAEDNLISKGSFKQIAGKTTYIPPHGTFLKYAVFYGIIGTALFLFWFFISMASHPQMFIALMISSLGADVFALAFPFIFVGIAIARRKNG